MLSQATFVLALAASASAHMIMAEPLPFGRATLNTFPLAPADFPCKQRSGAYTNDLGMNTWDAGETKSVKFNGTAAHGGGSCQFSITTDTEPTKESQWKVIHSVEGNCLTTLKGNFEEQQGKDPMMVRAANDIPVTMPSNIPDGQYTFAWTWLNRVGNREFYMNCAPIQVGSGSNTASTASASQALSVLPDMFVANLPDTECTTTEGQDFVYPDPGQSVAKGSVGTNFGSTLGGPACAVQNAMGAGAGNIGSPSPGTPSTPSKPSSVPSQPQVSEKPAPSPAAPVKGEPQPSKIPTNPGGGIFAPGASPAPAASSAPAAVPTPQPSPPAAAKPSPPAANPAPVTPPQTGSDNNTTPSNGECTPCTNDGAVVCIGTKQFGLCNRGCAVAQDLAAGMSCVAGVVVGSEKKRHAFPRAHLKRHFTAHGHHF